jgi:hypothetical protein
MLRLSQGISGPPGDRDPITDIFSNLRLTSLTIHRNALSEVFYIALIARTRFECGTLRSSIQLRPDS